MNKFTHTPGPWIFGQVKGLGTWVRPELNAGTSDIARIHDQTDSAGSAERSQEIALADARLISAAPAMLKALERLRDHGVSDIDRDFAGDTLAELGL